MTCATCGHETWSHEFLDEDADDNIYFGKCEVEGCTCEYFEDGE